jgi:hypothetical protein
MLYGKKLKGAENFGHGHNVPKRKFVATRIRKHLTWDLELKMHVWWSGTLQPCCGAHHGRWTGSGLLPVGTPNVPWVCSSSWQRRGISPSHCGCLSDYPQLTRRLALMRFVEVCSGSHWRQSDHFISMYSFSYKSEINVSGCMLFQFVEFVLKIYSHLSFCVREFLWGIF